MRRFLIAILTLETAALLGAAGVLWSGALEGRKRVPPAPPVFKPPIYEGVIGEKVRYRREDIETGRVLGYVDYTIQLAQEVKGTTTGRQFVMLMQEEDADKQRRSRQIMVIPRLPSHGWLPPRFEEDSEYPTGEQPVVKRITSAKVRWFKLHDPDRPNEDIYKHEVDGFLVEAVTPRRSLTEISERYWISDEVPVFGVARWERGDEVLILHQAEDPLR